MMCCTAADGLIPPVQREEASLCQEDGHSQDGERLAYSGMYLPEVWNSMLVMKSLKHHYGCSNFYNNGICDQTFYFLFVVAVRALVCLVLI
jgi:hypothetical protein